MHNPIEIVDTYFGKLIILTTDTVIYEHTKQYGTYIEQTEINFLNAYLKTIRNPVVLDIGANIGFFSFGMTHEITDSILIAIEPQPLLANMIVGSTVLNYANNIKVINSAVGDFCGSIPIPNIDYTVPSSFGSLELHNNIDKENIGQPLNTSIEHIPIITIDSLQLPKVDLIKIDVEGMELQVLQGSAKTITKYRPALFVELLKGDTTEVVNFIRNNWKHMYNAIPVGENLFFIPKSD